MHAAIAAERDTQVLTCCNQPSRTSTSGSRTLGPRNPDVPAFIAIGQTVEGAGEIGTLKAFHTAGFLGSEHGPFLIVDPQDAASAVRELYGENAPVGKLPVTIPVAGDPSTALHPFGHGLTWEG